MLISEVTFIMADPYGTFSQGDVIDTYWDPFTKIFSVQKNGVDYFEAGSGFIQTSNGVDSYWQIITINTPFYCDGTTLYTFGRDPFDGTQSSGAWPYIYFDVTPNSSVCSVTPVQSDLAWSGTPVITDSTSLTNPTGSISYSATSSYPPIYYGIAGQTLTAGVTSITGLGPGSYTWQAQDATGQAINYNFTIKDLSNSMPPPPTVVCDIAWSGSPTIGQDTGGGNGSINFSATSSLTIQYALRDFVYGDGNGQASGNFTGLSTGNYTIYAVDSAGCKISYLFYIPYNLVCDIAWSGLPTLAQDTGTNNGSITYSATSSYSPIQYALHDFAYNDGTGQSSGTFSNLRYGDYVLYARDTKNCLQRYPFNIPLNVPPPTPLPPNTTTYNIKYQVNFKDLNGVATVLNIIQKNFVGTSTIITAGDEPVTYALRLEGETDKYAPIRAGQLTVSLTSTSAFQFTDLFTLDNTTFRVLYYKGGNLKFVGKIWPQSYAEPYAEYQNYPIKVIATDGLVELDSIDFVDNNGSRYYGTKKCIEVIALALSKLDFQLGIRSSCNIYAISMSQTAADDPLDQAYVDTDSYYQEADALSCLEVIKRVLRPYGASICQWDGYWWIVRFEEQVGSTVAYREFNKFGQYITNNTFNPIVNIKKSTLTGRLSWTGYNAQMNMILPVGNIRVTYKQGKQDSLIRNGDFKLVKQNSSTTLPKYTCDLTGFSLIASNDPVCSTGFIQAEGNDPLDGAIVINGTGKCYLYSTTSFRMYPGDQIKIELKYRTTDALKAYRYQKVKMRVEYFAYNETTTYYLFSDGSWTTLLNNNSNQAYIYIYDNEPGKYKTFTVTADCPTTNTSAADTLKIFTFSSSPTDCENTVVNLTGADGGWSTLRAKVTSTGTSQQKSEVFYNGVLTTTNGNTFTNGMVLYYELENNTTPEQLPFIIRPYDYNQTTNPNQWVMKQQASPGGYIATPLAIDHLFVTYLPSGSQCGEDSIEALNPLTNKDTMDLTLYHGSPVATMSSIFTLSGLIFQGLFELQETKVTNANPLITHRNYFRKLDGTDWGFWKRDAVFESELIQTIFLRSYAAQYRQTCRRLTGSLTNRVITGDTPVYIAPYSMLKDNYDSRFYVPSGYSYMDKSCEYKGEFLEEYDITVGGTSTSGGASTFNSTFNSTFG